MAATGQDGRPRSLRASLWVFVSLAAVACAITLLFLGMRSVMKIGGTCASGGPYLISSPCPKGVPLVVLGGIWGGLVFAAVYDEIAAFDAERNGNRALQRREVLIEFSKEPKMVVQAAQIDGSFGR